MRSKTFELGLFENEPDAHIGLGGFSRLPKTVDWPLHEKTKKPFPFLLRIADTSLALKRAGIVIPKGHDVSVFCSWLPKKFDNNLALHDISDRTKLEKVPSRVIVHERGTAVRQMHERLPSMLRGGRGEFFGRKESTDGEGAAARSLDQISKAGGPPSWLQDPIPVKDGEFVLQVTSKLFSILGGVNFGHILGGGIGYLFLPKRPKIGVSGHFFVQFA